MSLNAIAIQKLILLILSVCYYFYDMFAL